MSCEEDPKSPAMQSFYGRHADGAPCLYCLPPLILMSFINVSCQSGNDLCSKTGQWYQEHLFFTLPFNCTLEPVGSSVLSSFPHKTSLHPAHQMSIPKEHAHLCYLNSLFLCLDFLGNTWFFPSRIQHDILSLGPSALCSFRKLHFLHKF